MKGADAIAQCLKREGVEFVIGYPVNPIFEAAAKVDIRTVIVRQERVGLHMADAVGRVTSGQQVGVFAMQWGPGCENAFGGVAQAFSESAPIVVLAGGYGRHMMNVSPNFNSFVNFRNITKWIEQVPLASHIPDIMRRAFTQAKNGRTRPSLIEIPRDVFDEETPEPISYEPALRTRFGPDPKAVGEVARVIADAKRPIIYAGQGVHYARAWQQLRELAEMLEIPVMTSLQGKSAFPENHPLALGSGNRTFPQTVHHFLHNSDVIFGIGCSFTRTNFGVAMPKGKIIIQATLDSTDLNKDVPVQYGLIGDAQLTLEALIAELKEILKTRKGESGGKVEEEIKTVKSEWMAQWMPKLTSSEVPLTPYRVIWDLMHTVDLANTIITHDAGSPRDQLAPFWESITPLSYIGWGKTTQLGYGLGLAMGAKLAKPDKLCINVMGDAAIGFTGMDFETAVRERIPIITIVLNNFSMACELGIMKVSTEKYHSTAISGNYADMAKAFGGYGERVEQPQEIIPAIKRAIRKTEEGVPVLLEFLTSQELAVSIPK
jgi:thiamine pyrophosphate-dependent acetolactate synthase large subunit-like protein